MMELGAVYAIYSLRFAAPVHLGDEEVAEETFPIDGEAVPAHSGRRALLSDKSPLPPPSRSSTDPFGERGAFAMNKKKNLKR